MKYFTLSKIVATALALGFFTATRLKADDMPGWYVGAEVGPAFVQSFNTTVTIPFFPPSSTPRSVFKPGVRTDFDVGYQFNRCWAVEGELGYINNQADVGASGGETASLQQMPFFVNGIYTLPLKWPVKPYVGLGIGLVRTWWDPLNDVNAAGQAIAGVKYDVSQHIDVGLSYKFIATTAHDWGNILDTVQSDGTRTHSILASVRFKF